MKSLYSKKNCIVDLGCGSGILSIIMKENGGFLDNKNEKKQVIGFDHSENAIECTKMNMQLFGMIA
jgi:ribosomal protein L11 methylase PrmA